MIKRTVDGRQYRTTNRSGRAPLSPELRRSIRIPVNLAGYESEQLAVKVSESGLKPQDYYRLALTMFDYKVFCNKELVKP